MRQRNTVRMRGRADCERSAGSVRPVTTARIPIAAARTIAEAKAQGCCRRRDWASRCTGSRPSVQNPIAIAGTSPIVAYDGVSSATKNARIRLGRSITSAEALTDSAATPRIEFNAIPLRSEEAWRSSEPGTMNQPPPGRGIGFMLPSIEAAASPATNHARPSGRRGTYGHDTLPGTELLLVFQGGANER